MMGSRKELDPGKPPGTSHSSVSFGQSSNSGPVNPAVPTLTPNTGTQSPHVIYQHIHDLSSKRISTLDYLRKAQDGRVYWFNTILFHKTDLNKMPYFDPKKLARRATNYLLLGLSLPAITEPSSQNPMDYLRVFNALLIEFETYQQIHPPDGSSSSSLSRARLPSMFKRSAHSSTGTKGRRTSSAADIGMPMSSTSDPTDLKAMTIPTNPPPASFPASEQELLPGEEYTHLLTPSLPFDPDFFETFATLCDVLIDAYTKIMSLVSSPGTCGPGVGDTFAKADARVRKLIIQGVVKEFDEASRTGAKAEVAGVGKVVLGGLM